MLAKILASLEWAPIGIQTYTVYGICNANDESVEIKSKFRGKK